MASVFLGQIQELVLIALGEHINEFCVESSVDLGTAIVLINDAQRKSQEDVVWLTVCWVQQVAGLIGKTLRLVDFKKFGELLLFGGLKWL